METLRSITTIPRLVLNDFKLFGQGIIEFSASFMRGYVAFFFELVDDTKPLLAPFFNTALYQSILNDFCVVLMGIVTPIQSFFGTQRTSLVKTLADKVHTPSTKWIESITFTPSTAPKKTIIDTTNYGPLRTFFAKYRALLSQIYDEVTTAMEETDEIPLYLIAAAILVFMLGCIWFYVIMVFGV